MYCLQIKFCFLVCIYFAAIAKVSLQENSDNKTRSVKKDLENGAADKVVKTHNTKNNSYSTSLINNVDFEETSITNTKSRNFQKNLDNIEIPDSFKKGFYFFIGLSLIATLLILIKIYRMRLSRAERKYGVHGDRTTQELTPLPMAVEDDSDNEDHTLFDINRQVRVS